MSATKNNLRLVEDFELERFFCYRVVKNSDLSNETSSVSVLKIAWKNAISQVTWEIIEEALKRGFIIKALDRMNIFPIDSRNLVYALQYALLGKYNVSLLEISLEEYKNRAYQLLILETTKCIPELASSFTQTDSLPSENDNIIRDVVKRAVNQMNNPKSSERWTIVHRGKVNV